MHQLREIFCLTDESENTLFPEMFYIQENRTDIFVIMYIN